VQRRAGAVDEAAECVFDNETDEETGEEADGVEGVATGGIDVFGATMIGGRVLAGVSLVSDTSTFGGPATRLVSI
jgi:hypothetical protein